MKWLIGFIVVFISPMLGAKPTLHIAVASNFTLPMKQIAAQWPEKSKVDVKLSFGSSGKIYAQIKQGAPFDIFLSADQEKPARLVQDKLAKAENVFTYGLGQLVLWSKDPALLSQTEPNWTETPFSRLAIANPRTAPYGKAAQDYLDSKRLQSALHRKLVTGENIAQTFAFVKSGNAQLGFIALSQFLQLPVNQRGSYWIVPTSLHSPIRQDAVILNQALSNPVALQFFAYLQSANVISMMPTFGYHPERSIEHAQ